MTGHRPWREIKAERRAKGLALPATVDTGHTCPGGCGGHVGPESIACAQCYALLPGALRTALAVTWGVDWPAHGRVLADALLWLAEHRFDRWQQTYAQLEEDG